MYRIKIRGNKRELGYYATIPDSQQIYKHRSNVLARLNELTERECVTPLELQYAGRNIGISKQR